MIRLSSFLVAGVLAIFSSVSGFSSYSFPFETRQQLRHDDSISSFMSSAMSSGNKRRKDVIRVTSTTESVSSETTGLFSSTGSTRPLGKFAAAIVKVSVVYPFLMAMITRLPQSH